MAVFHQNDVVVTIGGIDLSDHIASVSWSESSAELETTAFGSTNVSRIGGLKDGSISVEFHQDFAAASTYATLQPLLGTVTTVTVKPTSAATATDNPEHSVSALVTELPFIDGGVADLATVSVTWPFSGNVTVTTA